MSITIRRSTLADAAAHAAFLGDPSVAAGLLQMPYVDEATVHARLYRKFGFEIEGTMRGYALRHGRYVDAYTMARLHPAPPMLPVDGSPIGAAPIGAHR